MGISGANEIAAVEIGSCIDSTNFIDAMNNSLVPGINVNRASSFFIPSGKKKYSLSSLLWGSVYENPQGMYDYVSFKDEKKYREMQQIDKVDQVGKEGSWGLRRLAVLAKSPDSSYDGADMGKSFFDVFHLLYPENDLDL